jgi:hypothetical protein
MTSYLGYDNLGRKNKRNIIRNIAQCTIQRIYGVAFRFSSDFTRLLKHQIRVHMDVLYWFNFVLNTEGVEMVSENPIKTFYMASLLHLLC